MLSRNALFSTEFFSPITCPKDFSEITTLPLYTSMELEAFLPFFPKIFLFYHTHLGVTLSVFHADIK